MEQVVELTHLQDTLIENNNAALQQPIQDRNNALKITMIWLISTLIQIGCIVYTVDSLPLQTLYFDAETQSNTILSYIVFPLPWVMLFISLYSSKFRFAQFTIYQISYFMFWIALASGSNFDQIVKIIQDQEILQNPSAELLEWMAKFIIVGIYVIFLSFLIPCYVFMLIYIKFEKSELKPISIVPYSIVSMVIWALILRYLFKSPVSYVGLLLYCILAIFYSIYYLSRIVKLNRTFQIEQDDIMGGSLILHLSVLIPCL